MFRKKKNLPTIDKDQLELIQNAQKRIRQKKYLYVHFIIFLIGSIFIILTNTVLGIGKDYTIAKVNWFVYAIFLWLFIFLYHFINVFITHKFMGKTWKKQQLEKLVNLQQFRIEKLKEKLSKEEYKIAKSQLYNESLQKKTEHIEPNLTQLTIIVAAGEDNAIGKDNDLIWHLKDDLKRFKDLTNKHHIIMGRKTFESFPKPLPNRTHVVITRQTDYKTSEGIIVVSDLKSAFEVVKHDDQPFVIGGGEIYKQAIDLVDKLEVTRVHATFKSADTFFPEIDINQWKEINRITHDADENHTHAFSFITYIRR